MKTWAKGHDECQSCGTTTKPHKAKGLCYTCYYKQYPRSPRPGRTYQKGYTDGAKDGFDDAIRAVNAILRPYDGSCSYDGHKITLELQGKVVRG